jgi:hypothetical protein
MQSPPSSQSFTLIKWVGEQPWSLGHSPAAFVWPALLRGSERTTKWAALLRLLSCFSSTTLSAGAFTLLLGCTPVRCDGMSHRYTKIHIDTHSSTWVHIDTPTSELCVSLCISDSCHHITYTILSLLQLYPLDPVSVCMSRRNSTVFFGDEGLL